MIHKRTRNLDPIIKIPNISLPGDCAAIAGHVDGDEFKAGGVKGYAEEHEHHTAICSHSVMHDETDPSGRVGPAVEMEGVAVVMPYLFSGRVGGGEV